MEKEQKAAEEAKKLEAQRKEQEAAKCRKSRSSSTTSSTNTWQLKLSQLVTKQQNQKRKILSQLKSLNQPKKAEVIKAEPVKTEPAKTEQPKKVEPKPAEQQVQAGGKKIWFTMWCI